MPRVIEKTKNRAGAERNCGVCGVVIQPGERYLQWSFRYGGTRYRCMNHPPRRSDLTQSKMADVYQAIEEAELSLPKAEADDLQGLAEEVAGVAQQIAEEYREAAEMFGGEGENAERAEELEGWADEVVSYYPDDDDTLEDRREALQEVLDGCPL